VTSEFGVRTALVRRRDGERGWGSAWPDHDHNHHHRDACPDKHQIRPVLHQNHSRGCQSRCHYTKPDSIYLWSECQQLLAIDHPDGMGVFRFYDRLLGNPHPYRHVPLPLHGKVSRYTMVSDRDVFLRPLVILLRDYGGGQRRERRRSHPDVGTVSARLLCLRRSWRLRLRRLPQVQAVAGGTIRPGREDRPAVAVAGKKRHLVEQLLEQLGNCPLRPP